MMRSLIDVAPGPRSIHYRREALSDCRLAGETQIAIIRTEAPGAERSMGLLEHSLYTTPRNTWQHGIPEPAMSGGWLGRR